MFPKASNKQKGGMSLAFPDVCKTPAPPAPFVPIPYPNIIVASTNLKTASTKVKKFESKFKKSSGDDPATLKGLVTSVNKLSVLFSAHSGSVKVMGKNVAKLTLPNKTKQAFQQAQSQQKTFEKKVKKECDKLLQDCKDNKEQLKLAKELVSVVGKAARGHRL